MTNIGAREALEYAFSKEMVKIYGTLLIADFSLLAGGWLTINWTVRGGTSGLIGGILVALLLLTGFIIGVGALVAFIYKVLADARK